MSTVKELAIIESGLSLSEPQKTAFLALQPQCEVTKEVLDQLKHHAAVCARTQSPERLEELCVATRNIWAQIWDGWLREGDSVLGSLSACLTSSFEAARNAAARFSDKQAKLGESAEYTKVAQYFLEVLTEKRDLVAAITNTKFDEPVRKSEINSLLQSYRSR